MTTVPPRVRGARRAWLSYYEGTACMFEAARSGGALVWGYCSLRFLALPNKFIKHAVLCKFAPARVHTACPRACFVLQQSRFLAHRLVQDSLCTCSHLAQKQ